MYHYETQCIAFGVDLHLENILNKHCRKPTRVGPPAWWLGRGLTTHRKKIT
jgi:hypothetical protein